MTGRSAWEAHQRLDALLSMLADESAGGPGSVDPNHLDALRRAPIGRARDIAQAHANNAEPPAFDKRGD
ncbi:hypothetical protein [Haloferax sp. Q22]|uniref:hypothetical protein n=1 Tax=Haloferax sp. (strain Q22) TaxID=1526048 RepID=UPI000737CE5C|nr:hypothetical protein [Haloferax sp. Q22]